MPRMGICGFGVLRSQTTGETPNTVSLSMKTDEFREIKPQMDADERRGKSKITPLYLRPSAV